MVSGQLVNHGLDLCYTRQYSTLFLKANSLITFCSVTKISKSASRMNNLFWKFKIEAIILRIVSIVHEYFSGNLLHASARCVKPGGHFVEIGKYDLQTNSAISRSLVLHGCQMHGVQLDELWLDSNKDHWKIVHDLFQGLYEK